MAEPPAMVSRTFELAEGLQLHRLVEPARFHCVRCQQDKTAMRIVTMGGDWTQTICGGCLYALRKGQRKRAKKAKRRPLEADQQRERRRPGGDSLLAFFRAAGVSAKLVSGRDLRINGRRTQPLASLPAPGTLDWNNLVDKIAIMYLPDKFIKAVEDNARFGEGLPAFLRREERGFVIMRDDLQLALIHASRAQIPHREVIYGNFLTPGPHWQHVADVVHDAEPELVAEWRHEQEAKTAAKVAAKAGRRRAAARRRIDHLPDDLAPELIDACLDASRRIRLERQVAYERPAILECDVGELTLRPITGTKTRLLVPFRLSKGTEALQGELVLSDFDPLPLLIAKSIPEEDAITAWTCALLGFGDATCIEFEQARPQPARPRRRSPPSVPHRHSSTRTLPRKWPWPSHLEPVGHWIRYSGSFVAGHRRLFNDSQTVSEEARDRARQVGINLRPHETWVRPHTRGIPDGIEMRFLWHRPTELKLSHRRPANRGEGGRDHRSSSGHPARLAGP